MLHATVCATSSDSRQRMMQGMGVIVGLPRDIAGMTVKPELKVDFRQSESVNLVPATIVMMLAAALSCRDVPRWQ